MATIDEGVLRLGIEEQVDTKILLIIRDGHDDGENGMHFRLDPNTQFKHSFDAFRQRSCKKCRPRTGMTFEHNSTVVGDNVSSEEFEEQLGDQSIEVIARSDRPGLRCALCRPMGFPTTNGAVLDGRHSLVYDATLRRRWFHDSRPNESMALHDKPAHVRRVWCDFVCGLGVLLCDALACFCPAS